MIERKGARKRNRASEAAGRKKVIDVAERVGIRAERMPHLVRTEWRYLASITRGHEVRFHGVRCVVRDACGESSRP